MASAEVTPQPVVVGTCRDAIRKYWPTHLWEQAFLVLSKENGTEAPNRLGAINYDGSQDFGCMQINNKWHPTFFATKDWSNPEHNVEYAYQIYRSRGNFSAWYAVRGLLWN